MMRLSILAASGLLVVGCATQGPAEIASQEIACPAPAVAVVLPSPDYPLAEARNGYEDLCTVRFDVDPTGAPINMDSRCTYKAFADSAEEAMKQARFDPALSTSSPTGARCAAYDLEYRLTPMTDAL